VPPPRLDDATTAANWGDAMTISFLLALAACSVKGDDSGSGDSDSTPIVTDTGLAFTVYVPDATSSAGDALASECQFVLGKAYSCANTNPEVRWDNAPGDTRSFALILDDPDAGDFGHWAIYDLALTTTKLEAGISGQDLAVHTLPEGAVELENEAGSVGYFGSCPAEPHVYRWRIWALREAIDGKPEGSTAEEQFAWLAAQAEDLAYDVAETCHIYNP
jgi:Raf kinase inhibitor-like YbhB/YbcL family protein